MSDEPEREALRMAEQCTCGHEDSDGRADVLRCPVHGIGPEPWRDDPDGFRKRTREALRIARDAREAPPMTPEQRRHLSDEAREEALSRLIDVWADDYANDEWRALSECEQLAVAARIQAEAQATVAPQGGEPLREALDGLAAAASNFGTEFERTAAECVRWARALIAGHLRT